MSIFLNNTISEEDAVERLKNSLIISGQLKPADIVKVQVIQS